MNEDRFASIPLCNKVDNVMPILKLGFRELCLSEYKLGSGKFGTVIKGKWHQDENVDVAVKFIHRSKESEDGPSKDRIYHEINNHLKCCWHQNIVRIYDCLYDKDYFCIVMEVGQYGDLYALMQKFDDKRIYEFIVAEISRQIANAIKLIHNYGIIHRDIKTDNVILFSPIDPEMKEEDVHKIRAKLADFGWSTCAYENSNGDNEDKENKGYDKKKLKRVNTFCGTIDYLPPEMIRDTPYDFRVDIWSFGIMIYECVIGYCPFVRHTYKETYNAIKYDNPFPYPFKIKQDTENQLTSDTFKVIITKLLQKYPESRITIDEFLDICVNEWIPNVTK